MTDDKKPLIARDMTLDDLDGVVEVHKHCFSSDRSIFSALSPDVLKSYYGMFALEPESLAAVLEEPVSGRIAGFTFGTTRPGIQKRFLHHYYFRFLWGIIKGLLTSKAVWNAFRSRSKVRDRSRLGAYDSLLANAGVPAPEGLEDLCMGIGVHSDFRGGGNAARLIDYYVARAFEKGAVRVRGDVLYSNTASMTFFKHRGWEFKRINDTQACIWIDRPKNT